MDTGESARISRQNHCAGNAASGQTCGDYAHVLFSFAREAMGVAETPGIPCALCFSSLAKQGSGI
jgi:hypothetical protein